MGVLDSSDLCPLHPLFPSSAGGPSMTYRNPPHQSVQSRRIGIAGRQAPVPCRSAYDSTTDNEHTIQPVLPRHFVVPTTPSKTPQTTTFIQTSVCLTNTGRITSHRTSDHRGRLKMESSEDKLWASFPTRLICKDQSLIPRLTITNIKGIILTSFAGHQISPRSFNST